MGHDKTNRPDAEAECENYHYVEMRRTFANCFTLTEVVKTSKTNRTCITLNR